MTSRETELLELIRIAGGSETNDLIDVFWSSHAKYEETKYLKRETTLMKASKSQQ